MFKRTHSLFREVEHCAICNCRLFFLTLNPAFRDEISLSSSWVLHRKQKLNSIEGFCAETSVV